MATGDLKNNIKQLQSELKSTKFTQTSEIDIDGLVSGSPQTYLAIYHYIFTSYNTQLNNDISNSNNELYGKSDMRFIEAVYKILRDMFDYKPQINREQFFTSGFAERKVIMATDILKLVRRRYKPPTNSTFRVAAATDEAKISPREKVQQEPFERPRKVANKSPSSMAGAIVLHTGASGGYKIPKSALLSHRLSLEEQISDVPAVTTKTHRHRPLSSSKSGTDVHSETCPEVAGESISRSHPVVVKGSPDSIMKRMFLDIVSPALLKVNEKIGQLEIGVTNLEKKEQPKMTTDIPSSPAIVTGLTKQMADVVFKLETLTSRVVLIENRLLMIEAKLDGDENLKQVSNEDSSSYHSTRKDPADISQLVWSNWNNNMSSVHENISTEQSNDTNRKRESSIVGSDDGDDDGLNSVNHELKVVVTQENAKTPKAFSSKMEFIKTLVNTNDLEHTLNSDVSALDSTSDSKESSKLTQKSARATKIMESHFDDTVSPIRSYAAGSQYAHILDESVMSNIYEAETAPDKDDRRFSTPTHLMLDTSTMDRVSRINQMMVETKQLLH